MAAISTTITPSIPSNAVTMFGQATALMSSREIAELCEKEHKHVIRDIRVMIEALKKDGPDLDHPEEIKDSRGYTVEFLLNRDLTMTLVTGYSIVLRHRIVKRWQELEAQASDPMRLLNDATAMRGMLLTYTEKVIALESKVEEMKPAVEALDRISASEGSLTFTQAAKVLGVKRDTMTRWMVVNKWVYRQNGSWVAYQTHIQNGCLEYKEANYTNERTGMKEQKLYCHVTQKGLAKIARAFATEVL